MHLQIAIFRRIHTKTYAKLVKKKARHSIILNRSLFLKEHKSIQQRIIRNSILDVKGNLQGFTEKHISYILKLFLEGITGKRIDLIDDIIAKTSYEDLIIEKKKETNNKDFLYKLNIEEPIDVDEFGYEIKAIVLPFEKVNINKKDRFVKYFDYDKIKGGLYIRNRKDGDRFIPYGMEGSKKIKDYFIDEKIPKGERDRIPLVTDDENILWIVGYRSSDLYKITDNTKNILMVSAINTRV